MKKILLSIGLVAFIVVQLSAQNNMGKADDSERIAITPQVSDQQIPQGAKNMLINKMKQICAKNGLAGDQGNPFFVMDATVDILSKELTPTAPPMHALNMSINFFIKDATGNVYSQTSFNAKGVGQNETKAYMEGIKRVNVNSGQFKAMVDQGKEKIMEFYNSQCDFIISKATALHKQGNDREAIKVLKSVPPISKECYDKCMEILSTIEDPGDPEPVATTGGGESAGGTTGGATSVEIADQIFLVYKSSKVFGDKMSLYLEFENRGTSDYELTNYVYNIRIIDENGAEHKAEKAVAGGGDYYRTDITIIPGVPVKMECQFPKVNKVNMFEYKYNEKIFRIKDINLLGGSADFAGSGQQAAAGGNQVSNAPTSATYAIGDLLLAVFNNRSDFWHKEYVPAKVMSLATEATKGEYQLISLGEGTSATNWTKDIISKWHIASKEEIKDGMIVLYAEDEPGKNTPWRPGVVVMTDELYKDVVSVKGRWREIHKVNYKWIAIIDVPVITAPND
ncbi:MAG: hypothetical protein AB7S69_02600 [Salinivirgaceae bacterium]